MSRYNTNLAAEFYVLSMLHRFGAEANLTLGNKKSVDIVIVHDAGDTVTVDVKGLAGKTSWPVDNFHPRLRHFLVLVSFLGKINDPDAVPEVYVVPSDDVKSVIYRNPARTRKVIQLSTIRTQKWRFRSAWGLLLGSKGRGRSRSFGRFGAGIRRPGPENSP